MLRRSTLTLLALHLLATFALAADPRLSNLKPQGGQRGTELAEVLLVGQRLEQPQEILFDEPGIEVRALEQRDANTAVAKLAIAADCRLGIHGLWLRTAEGVSNAMTFHVGALPEIVEAEPNNDFAAPQAIPFGVVVNGVIENEDVDYFIIEAKKGERIACEIEGLRLGRAFFDPFFAILDARRFELARSDDSALLKQDGVCSIIAPEDGKYVIQVRESAYQGSSACGYRLHVGGFPRPTAVYPAGGKPGQTLEVRWLGDAAGQKTEQITLPAAPHRDFGLFPRDERGAAPSANPFRLDDWENTLEAEPNNQREAATPAVAPGALNGVLQEQSDVDLFRVAIKKGSQFDIHVRARALRTPVDAVLQVLDDKGTSLASNDDDAGMPDPYLRFTAPAEGDYLIRVKDHLGAGGVDYVYRVEITPVKPELTVRINELETYVAHLPEVPRGGRTALLVTTQRANFGGDLQIEMPDLPAGVTMETLPVAAARSTVPVLLTAAADAPLAGKVAPLRARAVDPNTPVVGGLRQQHWLVRGDNNRDVWSYHADSLPVVVTEPRPFSIEVVAPQAPLVQSGAMNLKVVARRSDGFKSPINVRLLENPPGVSSSNSINIAPDADSAEIPLTANGDAPPGVTQLIVVASASVNEGQVVVASQIFPLEVATPYLAVTFPKFAAEQGRDAALVVAVEPKKEFAGLAQVELVGLPHGVTTEPRELAANATEIQFPLKIAADARPGKHNSLICRAVVTYHGEPITHLLGGGELRIDAPLKAEPPK